MTSRFAPAADEVWRLQNDDDPECQWFRTAVRGKPDAVRGTMQGIYVITPNGKRLGSLNSTNPKHVLAMMERALESWRQLPSSERKTSKRNHTQSIHRWENNYPTHGLALERFARDIQGTPQTDPIRPVNRDTVWFTKDEANGWIPEATIGATREVSKLITDRLTRLVFVDNVRGQTIPFARPEVSGGSISTQVTAIRESLVDIRIIGRTHARAKGPWIGGDNYWANNGNWPREMKTNIFGHATIDLKRGEFTAFELVARGQRNGRTALNGRHREDKDKTYQIGFLLRMDASKHRIAPTFINVYDTDWVTPPPNATK